MTSVKLISVHIASGDTQIIEAARALSGGRFDIHVSATPQDALRAVRTIQFDVAVIDLHPGGFSLARRLQENPTSAATRVLMLCERIQDVWLCHQAGAVEVVIKPLTDPTALTEAVEKALKG